MFDTMISKGLIQVLWILMSIGVMISVLVSYQALFRPTGGQAFLHLIFLAVGLILVRVICEGMIVIFMIHENLESSARALEDIRSQRSYSPPPGSPAVASTSAQNAGWNATLASTATTTSAPSIISNPSNRGNWSGYTDSSGS